MVRNSSSPVTRLHSTAIVQSKSARPAMRCAGGRVVLRQGRWQANHTVQTCEGETVKPDLDAYALERVERRQSHSSAAVSVAWLEAPEGVQLLLVANEDFCRWQPTEKRF